jgi:ribonuclease Z
MVNISRIFVTHMHADHVLGVVAIMAVIMSGVGQTEAGLARLRAAGTAKKVR